MAIKTPWQRPKQSSLKPIIMAFRLNQASRSSPRASMGRKLRGEQHRRHRFSWSAVLAFNCRNASSSKFISGDQASGFEQIRNDLGLMVASRGSNAESRIGWLSERRERHRKQIAALESGVACEEICLHRPVE